MVENEHVPLTSEKITYGKTTFYFDKLNPIDAFSTLNKFLSEFQKAGFDGSEIFGMPTMLFPRLMKTIMSLDSEYLEELRTTLFKSVRYTVAGEAHKEGIALTEHFINTAFMGLNAGHVTSVLIRAWCVNFLDSFSVIMETLGLSLEVEEGQDQETPETLDS